MESYRKGVLLSEKEATTDDILDKITSDLAKRAGIKDTSAANYLRNNVKDDDGDGKVDMDRIRKALNNLKTAQEKNPEKVNIFDDPSKVDIDKDNKTLFEPNPDPKIDYTYDLKSGEIEDNPKPPDIEQDLSPDFGKVDPEAAEAIKKAFSLARRKVEVYAPNYNDGTVTLGEFTSWFQNRQSQRGAFLKWKEKMQLGLSELEKKYPKFITPISKLSSYIGDASLRGMLGSVAGTDKMLGKDYFDAIEKFVYRSFVEVWPGDPISGRLVGYAVSALTRNALNQMTADSLEILADFAKDKLSDLDDVLVRKSMKDFPDIKATFDVPEPILKLLDLEDSGGTVQAGASPSKGPMIKKFFRDYSRQLVRKYEEATKKIESGESLEDVMNEPLEFKTELGKDTFAEDALLRIKNAIGAKKKLQVDDMVVESKQRRRIIYRRKG